jgi:hypothetical protein
MRVRVMRGAVLLATAVAFAAVLAPSGAATSVLSASKTAEASWTRSFTWTIDKSVTPASHDMLTGQSGDSTYTIVLTKSAGTDSEVTVSGEVCVQNNGTNPTQNLAIFDRIAADVPGGTVTLKNGNIDVSGNPQLDPGESHCYAYSFVIVPRADATEYRNEAMVTVSNGSGAFPEAIFTVPATPTLINNSVNVDDTYDAGDAGPFDSSTSYTYTRTFTCDGDEGTHVNTATIVETGQSDSATVTVTCTPPPPPGGEGCTPGYWKNHPESWAAAGVPTDATMASRGFNVSASLTFMTALRSGGGGLTALLRHAAAAYLNAAHPSVDYAFTQAEIVAATNAAIASGNYDAQKDIFEDENEQGSPGFCD